LFKLPERWTNGKAEEVKSKGGREGGREGGVTLRLVRPHMAAAAAEACLDLVGHTEAALAVDVAIHAL